MSAKSSSGNAQNTQQTPSKMSLQSSQTMSLAKTLHVQDQIIEQLRADHAALREALELERNALRDCRLTSDREMKTLQRENVQINKIAKQQEVKIEELEKALAFAKDALACEQRNLKSLEKEHINSIKELKLRNSKEYDKSNKQEMLIDQLKSEIEDLKEVLESERNATNLLIREHNAEVKMLREEVRTKSTEAYRELKERAIRERDEYREMQEEAEKTYKVLEKDFRDALAAKDEELKRVKAESRLIQKELEDQLRACMKEPNLSATSSVGHYDYLNCEKMKKLKNEISILREQNRKLLNELELIAEENKFNEIKKENYFIPFSFQQHSEGSTQSKPNDGKGDSTTEVLFTAEKASRNEINRLNSDSNFKNLSKLGELRGKERTIEKLKRELSLSKQNLEKIHRLHGEELERLKRRRCDSSAKRTKPMLPAKKVKMAGEGGNGSTVRDIVRRLQERHNAEENTRNLSKPPLPARIRRNSPEDAQNSNQTLEDLKAIDEDIEKLRKQIEERDKIISALREAAEAKDKKLDQLMTEYSKLQTDRSEPECRTSLKGDARVQERNLTAFSTSPSPPLCNGELCWTDGFVNKNYHEPVYAQLLSDHTALQKTYNELREKLEAKSKEIDSDESHRRGGEENGINLIMAEQIRILKEREAQLMSEAEELREQNDLMEFRILELEECRKEEMINDHHKHRVVEEKNLWSERDLEEVSDSGVMSLPTSEDLTSDSELGDTIKNYLHSDNAIVPTLFPHVQINCNESPSSDLKQRKALRSAECLQESGIFEDSEVGSEAGGDCSRHSKSCQTESILDKTILEIIDSSCDLILSKNKCYLEKASGGKLIGKSDDLTTEISKLSEIQKRIQEKRENVNEASLTKSNRVADCPRNVNTAVYYEERLKQLEDKLNIYESSGDTKDVLLKKRLEKEVELSHRVKELRNRVASLEAINKRIEEERCEFEEAENDSRFQCQRLEVKVQELMDKNSELELELERQKMMMGGDRAEISRRKNLQAKTKEKILNAENSLSMIEAAMPAILAWNMFCLNQTKNDITEHLNSEALILDEKDPATEYSEAVGYPNGEVFQKLEELINDQKKLRVEYERAEEEAKQRETNLKKKIEELEGKSAKDREILEEMTSYLKSLRMEDSNSQLESSVSAPSTEDFEMFEELKQLAENEAKMRRKIDSLQRKEQAYLQTLQQADEIWANMEAEYKGKLAEAENNGQALRERVNQLENKQSELEEALKRGSEVRQDEIELLKKVDALVIENESLRNKITELANNHLEDQICILERENAELKDMIEKLKEELPLEKKKSECLTMELEVRREQYIQDKMTIEQLGKDLEDRNKSLVQVESSLHAQISDLTQELASKSKELSNLEVTVAELREEVETLENKVTELVGALQKNRVELPGDSSSSNNGRNCQSQESRAEDSSDSSTEFPVMKTKRITCQNVPKVKYLKENVDSDNEDKDSPDANGEQLFYDTESVVDEEEPPPEEERKCKRTVLKTVDSCFLTRSESEVLFPRSPTGSRELVMLRERELPLMEILAPNPEPKPPKEILIPFLTPQPLILQLHPHPALQEKTLRGFSNRCVVVDDLQYSASELKIVETQTTENDWPDEGKEAEITELSRNNMMLQKTLEKIEEESRLKDLELNELKQTVSEIRKEQLELESKLLQQTYSHPVESKGTETDFNLTEKGKGSVDKNEKEEDDDDECDVFEDPDGEVECSFDQSEPDQHRRRAFQEMGYEAEVIDYMQREAIGHGEARRESRNSDRSGPVLFRSPSMSNLQVALDNLPNKCRAKNALFRALLEEFKGKIDRRHYDGILKQIEYPPEANSYEVDRPNDYDFLRNSLKTTPEEQEDPPGDRVRNKAKVPANVKCIPINQIIDTHPGVSRSGAQFDFTAPVTTLRKVGADSLFIEWQTDLQPRSVVGFEICLNGNLHHRVRSASRNKALLHSIDFTRENTISLYAMSVKGRSVKCTSVICPAEESLTDT